MRETVIKEIFRQKIIAIIRGADEQQALAAAKALYVGGIALVEVTFNQKAPKPLSTPPMPSAPSGIKWAIRCWLAPVR